jgi:predicted nucleic acid-binding protein
MRKSPVSVATWHAPVNSRWRSRLGEPGADAAAEIRRALEQDGVAIGMADSLIAGIVVVHHGVLLTRNRRHFERVSGLALGRMSRTEGD